MSTTTTQPDLQIISNIGAQLSFHTYRFQRLWEIHVHHIEAESRNALQAVLGRIGFGIVRIDVPDTETHLHCWLRSLHWHCDGIHWGTNGDRDVYVFERVVR